jgi:hypothetical protein
LWQGESGIQSFDLDGVDSIPAIPLCRLPALLIISINWNDDTGGNSLQPTGAPALRTMELLLQNPNYVHLKRRKGFFQLMKTFFMKIAKR